MKGKTNSRLQAPEEREFVNIRILSNQPRHDDLKGLKVHLSYADVEEEHEWGGGEITLSVPIGVKYTLSFGEVEGYKTPDSVTFTSVDGNARLVDVTYYAEHVVVNVSTDLGDSAEGAVVNVEKKIPNGVYIQDVNGRLWTEAEWDGSVTPNGIAVITSNCRFVMALEDAYTTYCQWGSYGTTVNGITTTTSSSGAAKDYDGEAQTTVILKQLGNNPTVAPAAYYCRAFKFPDGKVGYLGAAGEWQAALDNKAAVESALSKCGGTTIGDFYWTSTQYGPNYSWCMNRDNNSLNYYSKGYNLLVRAFAAFELPSLPPESHPTKNGKAEFNVAHDVSYTLSLSEMDGFIAPSSQTFTAETTSRTVSMTYIASALKVNITSNQGTDATIAAVKAVVSYGSTSVEVCSGETIVVPNGTKGTVTFPEVEGYLTPDAISFNHNGSTIVSGEYKCELLTVNVTADSGSVSGFEVTISKQETVGVSTKYTRLEYIENNGSQYIDTGFKPNNNTRVVADCEVNSKTSTFQTVFAARDANLERCFSLFVNSSGYFYPNIGIKTDNYIFTSFSAIGRSNIDANKNAVTINGNSCSFTARTFQNDTNLYLFSCNENGTVLYPCSMKLYSCQIYDNGVLVRDYMPVLRSDGIAGLYDAVNDKFYASSGNGNFIAGAKSEEVIAVQTSVTGTYKIPFGASYTIEASDVAGYITPSVYGKTADVPQNVVSMQYVYNPDPGITNPTNGVWIQSTDGKFYAESDWDGSKTPNGVAVVTSNCRFVMALKNAHTTYCEWGSIGTEVTGVTTTGSVDAAKTDYDGEVQTTTILNQLGNNSSAAPAAYYCRAYTFPNGKKGYLGAGGEWQAVLDNKAAVESALSKCGGSSMSGHYWTSTQYSSNFSWFMYLNGEVLSYYDKDNGAYVRAFAAI